MGDSYGPEVDQGDGGEALALADAEVPGAPDGQPPAVLVQAVPVVPEPLKTPRQFKFVN